MPPWRSSWSRSRPTFKAVSTFSPASGRAPTPTAAAAATSPLLFLLPSPDSQFVDTQVITFLQISWNLSQILLSCISSISQVHGIPGSSLRFKGSSWKIFPPERAVRPEQPWRMMMTLKNRLLHDVFFIFWHQICILIKRGASNTYQWNFYFYFLK